jgi:hypothetical protein
VQITQDTFVRADTNSDNALDREEYGKQHGTANEMMNDFDFFDENSDSKLDKYEYEAMQSPYKQSPQRVLDFALHKANEELDHITGSKTTADGISWDDYKKYHKYDPEHHDKEGGMGGPVSQLKKKWDESDENKNGNLDHTEYAKFHLKTHAPVDDPVEDEVMYIMHELTRHKHETTAHMADMRNERATMKDAHRNFHLFINYNARIGKEAIEL